MIRFISSAKTLQYLSAWTLQLVSKVLRGHLLDAARAGRVQFFHLAHSIWSIENFNEHSRTKIDKFFDRQKCVAPGSSGCVRPDVLHVLGRNTQSKAVSRYVTLI